MGTVTGAFASALASAAGLRLCDDGRVLNGDAVVLQLPASRGKLPAADYFDLVEWVRLNHPDRAGLPLSYARAVNIDNLGALGLCQ